MPANALQQEILFIPTVPDAGVLAAVVGDSISLAVQQTFAAQTNSLTRRPSGSSAAIASNSFTADVSGYFQATVMVSGITRNILVVAFPASVLTQKSRPTDPNSPLVNRGMLGNLVLDPRVTPATITTALESGTAFTLNAICGGGFVGWSSFGG